uniref:Uncharacterized protein n=1 Tax=Clastoptera arizonana TaxID=38151 RepID=A0A1B6CL10_9HEMI
MSIMKVKVALLTFICIFVTSLAHYFENRKSLAMLRNKIFLKAKESNDVTNKYLEKNTDMNITPEERYKNYEEIVLSQTQVLVLALKIFIAKCSSGFGETHIAIKDALENIVLKKREMIDLPIHVKNQEMYILINKILDARIRLYASNVVPTHRLKMLTHPRLNFFLKTNKLCNNISYFDSYHKP